MAPQKLHWQSQLILLLVLPAAVTGVALQGRDWVAANPAGLAWTLAISTALGLIAWLARAGTPAAAFTGAVLNASLMFSTGATPFAAWRTAMVPVLVFLVATSLATRFGRARKERLGTAEERHGRGAAQVAANLGFAALACTPAVRDWAVDRFSIHSTRPVLFFAVGLAALAEAAADTISSEIGQVLGGTPRMLTTLRPVEPGTDGGITIAGTLAGVVAAGLVAGAGTLALSGGSAMLALSWVGGLFGLFFDSLLGATLERQDLLNNDAVNFLSTVSAALVALALLALLPSF